MTGAGKLLAIDLDGTLLDASGRPHARDVKAVHAALAAGVSVSIVTGRLYSGSRAAAEVLGLRGAVGCADGSHVVLASDHTTLLHRGVGGADAVALRQALAKAKAATFVFAKDAIGHDARGTPYVGYMSTWSNDVRIAQDRAKKVVIFKFRRRKNYRRKTGHRQPFTALEIVNIVAG